MPNVICKQCSHEFTTPAGNVGLNVVCPKCQAYVWVEPPPRAKPVHRGRPARRTGLGTNATLRETMRYLILGAVLAAFCTLVVGCVVSAVLYDIYRTNAQRK